MRFILCACALAVVLSPFAGAQLTQGGNDDDGVLPGRDSAVKDVAGNEGVIGIHGTAVSINNDDIGVLPGVSEMLEDITGNDGVIGIYSWGQYQVAFVESMPGVDVELIWVRGAYLGVFPSGSIDSLPGTQNAATITVTWCWTTPSDDNDTPEDESDDTPGVPDWVPITVEADNVYQAITALRAAVAFQRDDMGWTITPGACPPLHPTPDT